VTIHVMKKRLIALIIFLSPLAVLAQSKTIEALQKKFGDSFTLFFYKNTLRMLNQTDNKEFDEMIKNIEKMRFIMIDKTQKIFATADYTKLIHDYKGETYEQIMTTRFNGKTFDVYLKDKKGSPLGTVVLVNDSTRLYVLDILGTIDVRKAGSLFAALDENSDIGQKIKSFLDKDEKHKDGGKKRGLKIE
jgi:hypothetical protein